jgi:hypothetical protein
LKVGDTFKTIDGKTAIIKSIKLIEEKEPFYVYNLEVPIHNNFIVGAHGIIVHNSNLPDRDIEKTLAVIRENYVENGRVGSQAYSEFIGSGNNGEYLARIYSDLDYIDPMVRNEIMDQALRSRKTQTSRNYLEGIRELMDESPHLIKYFSDLQDSGNLRSVLGDLAKTSSRESFRTTLYKNLLRDSNVKGISAGELATLSAPTADEIIEKALASPSGFNLKSYVEKAYGPSSSRSSFLNTNPSRQKLLAALELKRTSPHIDEATVTQVLNSKSNYNYVYEYSPKKYKVVSGQDMLELTATDTRLEEIPKFKLAKKNVVVLDQAHLQRHLTKTKMVGTTHGGASTSFEISTSGKARATGGTTSREVSHKQLTSDAGYGREKSVIIDDRADAVDILRDFQKSINDVSVNPKDLDNLRIYDLRQSNILPSSQSGITGLDGQDYVAVFTREMSDGEKVTFEALMSISGDEIKVTSIYASSSQVSGKVLVVKTPADVPDISEFSTTIVPHFILLLLRQNPSYPNN